MSPAFAITAAAVAAACGWPACALVATLGTPARTARQVRAAGEVGPAPTGQMPLRAAGEVGPAPTADARPADAAGEAVRPARPGATGTVFMSLVLAALAFGMAVRLHPALLAVAGCWLATCGVPLGLIDARIRRLPDVLTWGCLAGIAVLLTAAAATSGDWSRLAISGCGALAAAAFFAVLAVARPGSAGLGDAKLGLSTGAMAAWFGWLMLLWALFAAFALAACCGLALVAAGRLSVRGGSLPFGPFLLAGCLLMVSLPTR